MSVAAALAVINIAMWLAFHLDTAVDARWPDWDLQRAFEEAWPDAET